VTVVFGDFSLTDRPLHQFLITTNEQDISVVSIFDGREQVLTWADFISLVGIFDGREQVLAWADFISLVGIFDGREQVFARADFRRFVTHSIFLN
jgi:hypothetical protein